MLDERRKIYVCISYLLLIVTSILNLPFKMFKAPRISPMEEKIVNLRRFPLATMGVLAPGSFHA